MTRYEIILQKPVPPDTQDITPVGQEQLDNDEALKRVEKEIKQGTAVESIRGLLENAGFTDITENSDHTFNATRGRFRYIQMYLSGYDPGMPENDAVKIENVSYTYWKEGPGFVTTRPGGKSLAEGFL